jgi:hypothetical protein
LAAPLGIGGGGGGGGGGCCGLCRFYLALIGLFLTVASVRQLYTTTTVKSPSFFVLVGLCPLDGGGGCSSSSSEVTSHN